MWVVRLCFWPCPLASSLDKLAWTRHLRTHGLDDFEIKRWAIWRGHPIDRSKQKIQQYRRRATRMCFEPLSLLCRVHFAMRIKDWKLATLVLICRMVFRSSLIYDLQMTSCFSDGQPWKYGNCWTAWWPSCRKWVFCWMPTSEVKCPFVFTCALHGLPAGIEVSLHLNADKTVILPGQSQPLSTITTDHGITLRVLPGKVTQKWLGCMLIASEKNFWDLQFHL